MQRINFATALFVGLALALSGSLAGAADPPKDKPSPEGVPAQSTGPQSEEIAQLWEQIGQLHKQIVALELRGGELSEPPTALPGQKQTQRGRSDIRLTAAKEQGAAPQPAPPSDVPGDLPPVAPGDTRALWKSVADVHRQLVAMAAAKGERPSASPAPLSPVEPGKTLGASPGQSQAPKAIEKQSRAQRKEAFGRAESAQAQQQSPQAAGRAERKHNPLLMQYARLHMQIIEREVEEAQKSEGPSSIQPPAATSESQSAEQPKSQEEEPKTN